MTETPSTSEAPAGGAWQKIAMIAVLAGCAVLVVAFDLHTYLSFDALKTHRESLLGWYADNGVVAMAVFVAVYAVVVALSLPGAVWMTIGGGFVFGIVQATGLVVVGATIGAVAIFLIARFALREFFMTKTGDAIRRMEQGFNENALSYMLVLRFVPLFPFWLVNLVPALLGVRLTTYAFGTFFGIIPGTFVYCSVGNGLGAVIDQGETPDLGVILKPEILTPILGLALLSLVPVAYKRFKKRADTP